MAPGAAFEGAAPGSPPGKDEFTPLLPGSPPGKAAGLPPLPLGVPPGIPPGIPPGKAELIPGKAPSPTGPPPARAEFIREGRCCIIWVAIAGFCSMNCAI